MAKKVVICAMQVPYAYGGAEVHIDNLNFQLQQRGYQSTIVNIPFKWYPKNEIMKHALIWRMLDLSEVDGEKIDLVIATKFPSYGIRHDNKITWLLHQYRQLYDLYLTPYSEFTDSLEDRQIRQMVINFDNQMLPESRKIFANSQTVAKRLAHYNEIASEPLYHPPKHEGKYYCDRFDDYIFTVSRLEPAKRLDLLIKAMQYTPATTRCLIAGKGPQQEQLAKLIEECNVQDRVQLLGFVDDQALLSLYANAAAIYYAPYDEDYGYVSLEAFLSHKPLITTADAGGVLEFAEDQRNAYVRQPDPVDIAQAINQVFQDKSLARQLGNQGYQDVQHISWDHVIDQLTATMRTT